MIDRYQPLRDAIDAGPTPGRWEVGGVFDNDGHPEIVIERKTPVGNLAIAVCLPGLAGQKANAAFITAACNSARELLEDNERLREALKGLDEAYCRAGSPLSKEERHEDRMRLIAARTAISLTGAKP